MFRDPADETKYRDAVVEVLIVEIFSLQRLLSLKMIPTIRKSLKPLLFWDTVVKREGVRLLGQQFSKRALL